ncbi:MAG: redox-regulated ATPase YchF, partial [Gammaproteobacteria bacterium]|nr:redox-regulated ATPase YchF [Gammaproteobacteria bacterium]
VPDERLGKIDNIINSKKIIKTAIEFVDIAGLVKGASKGEGLGNKFLGHIRETQAIAHVVRCFSDDNVTHVEGAIDPKRDIETISTELLLADMETVDKAVDKATKQAKSGDKQMVAEKNFLEQIKQHIDSGQPARTFATSATETEMDLMRHLHLLTAKPVLYIANVDESGFSNNPYLEQVTAIAAEEGAKVVPISANIEAELIELADDEKQEFLNELGLKEPGLDRLIRVGYELLGLKTFLTAGPQEVRAWTFKDGMLAPQTAGVIHTDFEKGFIRAEVIAFADYIKYKGELGAKEAGKMRLEGKAYVVQDGDVMHFRFNV